jgi:branched-chain amino acid transport system substrate-binding protein
MTTSSRARVAALLSAATIASAGLLGACSSPGGSGNSPSGAILIGQLTAGSGTYGSLSTEESQGRAFAIDQINAAGGIDGRRLRLVTEDWQSNTALVSNDATQLIRQGVVAVLGPDTSTASVQLDPLMASAKVPMINSAGLNPAGAYSFSVQPLDYFTLVTQYAKDHGASKICDLGAAGASFEAVQAVIHPAAAATGIAVGTEISFDPTLPDLTPQVTELKAAGCTAIFAGASGSSLALVASAMTDLGMTSDLLMSQGANATTTTLEQMEASNAFTYFPIPVASLGSGVPAGDPKAAEIKPFVQAWTSKFGKPPTVPEVVGYANVEVLAAALRSGATTGPAIKSYLESGKTITTPLASFRFSPSLHAGADTTGGYFEMAHWDVQTSRFELAQQG